MFYAGYWYLLYFLIKDQKDIYVKGKGILVMGQFE